jgi:DNA invertase Pin-like site-specific DNA recombinase
VRVALYARVSTTDQDAELQLVELRRYAAARGWPVAKEFVDPGVSGAAASRPALDQLRTAARRRDVDAVLVWRFDRFSRSITDLVAALEEFRALGVAFVSIHEQIDTSSPTGRVVFAVVAAMAEFEREILRERVKAGLARARERGVRLGRPLKLDALEVLRLRRGGMSVRAIARQVAAPASTVADLLARHAVSAAPKPNAKGLRAALGADSRCAGKE